MFGFDKKKVAVFSVKYRSQFAYILYASMLVLMVDRYLLHFVSSIMDDILTIIMAISALIWYFSPKYKRYKFQLRESECRELLNLIKAELGPDQYNYNFKENIIFLEHFDKNASFKYTEVIVHSDSDYRVMIEELKLDEKRAIPFSLKPTII